MKLLAFDTETALTQPGLATPPLVLGSMATVDGARLLSADDCRTVFREALRSPDVILVGANIAFDMMVLQQDSLDHGGEDLMPLIWAKYEDQRLVYDVLLAEQLGAIAHGRLGQDNLTGAPLVNRTTGKVTTGMSLDNCTEQVLDRIDAKRNDLWRLRYHEFLGQPLSALPAEAAQYPVDDARNTLECALGQLGEIPSRWPHEWGKGGMCTACGQAAGAGSRSCMVLRPRANLFALADECASAFALSLGAGWGFARDGECIEQIARAYEARHRGKDAPFIAAGILRPDGTECRAVLVRHVAIAYGTDPASKCGMCEGTGRVRSTAKSRGMKNCTTCKGTGLELSSEVPRTEKDGILANRDTLFESGDELLIAYAEEGEEDKIPASYLPYLREGLGQGPLTLSPNPILETRRVSYRGLIQTFPRRPGMWIEGDV